ncbi:MAG: PrsW family intramembrane metalloprotease [Candidatus Peribacteraceae bacterium]|nr:PrsW family intramembrane metalloprotease [Candidatus Peribacteraceae bacterium]
MGFSLLSFVAFIAVSALLIRLWFGVVNVALIHVESIKSLESRRPYLPSFKTLLVTYIGTAIVFFVALQSGIHNSFGLDSTIGALILGTLFISVAGVVATFNQRFHHVKELIFSIAVGTVLAAVLTGFTRAILTGNISEDPAFMALGFVCIVLAWRLLFGPWSEHVKATVLGTFIFVIGGILLWNDPQAVRTSRILASIIAIIPAILWCLFFLKYHKQRLSMVFLMFFAGMLSTAPILFYDKLVRSGVELQFFFFRIVPENFSTTSTAFISGNLVGMTGVRSTLVVTFVSFLFVGIVEEVSKFWVIRKSGRRFFSSIDDVLQLSIIVAIGFAFAENVLNPTYFMNFVRAYILTSTPNWGAFVGNVLGRAILTNMVHIVSTGVMGYFMGVALFAGPILKDGKSKGRFFILADGLNSLLRLPKKPVFRKQMLIVGLTFAILLHGLYNFLVTFPDLLPGRPQSIGHIFGMSNGLLGNIPIVIIPALFYVVGGSWLLTELFYKKENMKERGRLVVADTFVTD